MKVRLRHVPRSPALGVALVLAIVGAGAAGYQIARPKLGLLPDGRAILPTNQSITPLGTVARIQGGRPKELALSPDGSTLAVLVTNGVRFYTPQGASIAAVMCSAGAAGLAWSADSAELYVSSSRGSIYRIGRQTGSPWWSIRGETAVDSRQVKVPVSRRGNPQVNGLAASHDGTRLYAALGVRNCLAVLSLPTLQVVRIVPVGVAPYAVHVSGDGRIVCVANRGGRSGASGPNAASAGTPVSIDPATDAALRGSVTIVDTASFRSSQVDVGRQPAAIELTQDGSTLYVANADNDTISVVDVQDRRVASTFSIRPAGDPGFGQIPTSLALSATERTLYVACGGANAIAMVKLTPPGPRVNGYIPTGWYPISVEEPGQILFVACAKGYGARPEGADRFSVHDSTGIVEFVAPSVRGDIQALTRSVARNNRWGPYRLARPWARPQPVPFRLGEPSLFKHVVYIIKENHTYDLDLGDMKEGDGDPRLALFGEQVTPNEHALARQFVLLDNTYTSGTNSADGHQWTDSCIANDYVERSYGCYIRSYPYNGGDPLAYSPVGFLWTAARRKGLSVRVYGEFANRPRVINPRTGKSPSWRELWEDHKAGTGRYSITADTDCAALRPLLHPHYVGWPITVSDQYRASLFLQDLKQFEDTGDLPALSILLLPSNHTEGNRRGMPTPRAMVADNDLALGRIVDGISHSRFWGDTLILVIEDDSQFGLDHVDGHRTVAFCISAYTRRGAVISVPYNHTSFVRTIELVLGIPAMTRFDRTAFPLWACFQSTPRWAPYTHVDNRIPLDEMNLPPARLRGQHRETALRSARLDWTGVDRADAEVIARSAWVSARPGEPFPEQHFHPNQDEDD